MIKKITTGGVVGSLIREYRDKIKGKGKAGVSGKMFESVVGALKILGFKDHNPANGPDITAKRYIMRNVPYDNLLKQTAEAHGLPRKHGSSKTEFVIVARDANQTKEFPMVRGALKVRIECKWQESAGTTQAKLPYSLIDLQYSSPEDNIILLVDGQGFDEAMKLLIRDMSDGVYWDKAPKTTPKKVVVMDTQEFMDWCGRAFS
jgi:hypothetical protein